MLFRSVPLISRTFSRYLSVSSCLRVNVGDKIPNISLHVEDGTPAKQVSAFDLLEPFQKALIVGVPGAFTPACSSTHVPSFIKNFDALKSKGVDKIVCVSVNDGFVMSAWSETLKAGSKIHFLADPSAEFTKALQLDFDATKALGGIRAKRFVLMTSRGIVQHVSVEKDNTGIACTLAKHSLEFL